MTHTPNAFFNYINVLSAPPCIQSRFTLSDQSLVPQRLALELQIGWVYFFSSSHLSVFTLRAHSIAFFLLRLTSFTPRALSAINQIYPLHFELASAAVLDVVSAYRVMATSEIGGRMPASCLLVRFLLVVD